jgi:hypothetical protein
MPLAWVMRVAKGATGAPAFKPSQARPERSYRQQTGKNLQNFHFGKGHWPSTAANFTLELPSKDFSCTKLRRQFCRIHPDSPKDIPRCQKCRVSSGQLEKLPIPRKLTKNCLLFTPCFRQPACLI